MTLRRTVLAYAGLEPSPARKKERVVGVGGVKEEEEVESDFGEMSQLAETQRSTRYRHIDRAHTHTHTHTQSSYSIARDMPAVCSFFGENRKPPVPLSICLFNWRSFSFLLAPLLSCSSSNLSLLFSLSLPLLFYLSCTPLL